MHGLPVSLPATVSSFSQGEPVVGPIFEPHNSKAPLNGFSTAYSNAQATLHRDRIHWQILNWIEPKLLEPTDTPIQRCTRPKIIEKTIVCTGFTLNAR